MRLVFSAKRHLQYLRRAARSLRWRMLAVFIVFSALSPALVLTLSVAIANVVVRRESAYLIEERLNAMSENQRFNTHLPQEPGVCGRVDSPSSKYLSDLVWPGSVTQVETMRKEALHKRLPHSLSTDGFTGLIIDDREIAIRSVRKEELKTCEVYSLITTPLTATFLEQLSQSLGTRTLDTRGVSLSHFQRGEGSSHELAATILPGFRWAVPVIVTVRSCPTGATEDWVICRVHLSYLRTFQELRAC